jgi:hypothetical protein
MEAAGKSTRKRAVTVHRVSPIAQAVRRAESEGPQGGSVRAPRIRKETLVRDRNRRTTLIDFT